MQDPHSVARLFRDDHVPVTMMTAKSHTAPAQIPMVVVKSGVTSFDLTATDDIQVAAGADAALPHDPAAPHLVQGPSQNMAQRLAGLGTGTNSSVPQSHHQISAFGLPCAVEMTATVQPMAMVRLTLNAPCSPGQVVRLDHQALKVSALTDETGALVIDLPVLSGNAVFVAGFDNGIRVEASADVPQVEDYDRVALMWQGRPTMHIHAYENGAAADSAGHITANRPKGPATGAVLTTLGSSAIPGGWTAEVLTAPANARDSGVLRLHIEAEITASTCGRDANARTIQGQEDAVDLTLSMPGCDAIGDFLVLKNILHDIKLAAN